MITIKNRKRYPVNISLMKSYEGIGKSLNLNASGLIGDTVGNLPDAILKEKEVIERFENKEIKKIVPVVKKKKEEKKPVQKNTGSTDKKGGK